MRIRVVMPIVIVRLKMAIRIAAIEADVNTALLGWTIWS
jgi:hypothetical protein